MPLFPKNGLWQQWSSRQPNQACSLRIMTGYSILRNGENRILESRWIKYIADTASGFSNLGFHISTNTPLPGPPSFYSDCKKAKFLSCSFIPSDQLLGNSCQQWTWHHFTNGDNLLSTSTTQSKKCFSIHFRKHWAEYRIHPVVSLYSLR